MEVINFQDNCEEARRAVEIKRSKLGFARKNRSVGAYIVQFPRFDFVVGSGEGLNTLKFRNALKGLSLNSDDIDAVCEHGQEYIGDIGSMDVYRETLINYNEVERK